jgi:hypothetical protein
VGARLSDHLRSFLKGHAAPGFVATPTEDRAAAAGCSGLAASAAATERNGWRLAGIIVPIAYIAWSIWLIALGIFLLL